MTPNYSARKPHGTRTILLSLALGFAGLTPILLGLMNPPPAAAQTPPAAAPQASAAPAQAATPATAQGLEGTWQGTLHVGQDLRTVLKVSKADGGGYKGDFYSIDQAPQPFPLTKITLDGSTVKYSLTAFDLKFEGKLSADGKTIEGTSTQAANSLPRRKPSGPSPSLRRPFRPWPPTPTRASKLRPSSPASPARKAKGLLSGQVIS